ncbi:uncharacterized protein [Aegilops tauschii subsp. strangulata]|uniref:uncharacterized protein n=1 Tax=Aegilops tauschii subsp. strangulata TaxID=200361 RepID=UPI003CC87630
MAFLTELQVFRSTCAGPWLVGGDFNIIVFASDKNNGRLNDRSMSRFRRFIPDMELSVIYLHGRRYSWSNEQVHPTLVRNDRVLCTPSWEAAQPSCMLCCLALTISYHSPLLIDCTTP